MASINEKLNYINETKSLIKDKLNDLGSEITNQTTFRDYADKIEDLYEEWPKTNAENTIINLNNTKKAKMNLQLKGNTYQFTTTGKNIYDGEYEIGGYSIDTGEKTNNNSQYRNKNIIPVEPDTQYKFSINGTAITEQPRYFFYDSNKELLSTSVLTSSFTTPADCYFINWHSSALKTDYPNGLSKTQIEKGPTATSYEPYTGGMASPNSNYPQNIENVNGNNIIKACGNTIIPIEYTQVDYIESSGTQYIDTGYKPNQNTRIETELWFNKNYNNRHLMLYGTRGVGDVKSLILWDFHTDESLQYTFGSVIKNDKTVKLIDNSYNQIIHDNNGLSLNEKLVIANTNPNPATWSATYNLLIFTGRTTQGAVDSRMASEKIKSFKIYDNNTLVRNFIPCYRDSDNEVGLYDLVNNVFYTNQGTGTFTYGNVIENIQQIYPINLATIELCKIGTYQDYIYKDNNKWYKYGKICKIVLDGSENWDNDYGTVGTDYRHNLRLSNINSPTGVDTSGFSSYFIYNRSNSAFFGSYYINTNFIVIQDKNKVYTLEQLKTWLGTHTPSFYYVLATPIITEITDNALLTQLNNLYNINSYEEVTNISQTNNSLPFIISATALLKNSN